MPQRLGLTGERSSLAGETGPWVDAPVVVVVLLAAPVGGLEKSRRSCNESGQAAVERRSASGGLTVRCFRDNRRPDGWCPADVAMPVSAAICGPDRCPAAHNSTPATSVDTGGPCGSHRGPANSCGAQPDPVRDRCYRRPQPCWFRHAGRTQSQAGARTAAVFRNALAGLSAVMSAAACDRVRVRPTGRLRRCPVSTVPAGLAVTRPCAVRRRTLPQPVSVRRYRKRSPGRRPLVGCSHRRQARRSCRASRSRSCSRI
jgi:hypothetical protein